MLHPREKKKETRLKLNLEGVFLQLTALSVWPRFFLDFAHETVNSVFVYPYLQGIIGGQAKKKINIVRKRLFKANTKRFKHLFRLLTVSEGKEVGFQLLVYCCQTAERRRHYKFTWIGL